MTREEAIQVLNMVEAHGSLVIQAKEMAIKALEQEPCIPTRDLSEEELKHFAEEMKKVRPQVVKQESVIDKIRAEINSPNRGTCDYFIVDRIEEIIDKYKAESEE